MSVRSIFMSAHVSWMSLPEQFLERDAVALFNTRAATMKLHGVEKEALMEVRRMAIPLLPDMQFDPQEVAVPLCQAHGFPHAADACRKLASRMAGKDKATTPFSPPTSPSTSDSKAFLNLAINDQKASLWKKMDSFNNHTVGILDLHFTSKNLTEAQICLGKVSDEMSKHGYIHVEDLQETGSFTGVVGFAVDGVEELKNMLAIGISLGFTAALQVASIALDIASVITDLVSSIQSSSHSAAAPVVTPTPLPNYMQSTCSSRAKVAMKFESHRSH